MGAGIADRIMKHGRVFLVQETHLYSGFIQVKS